MKQSQLAGGIGLFTRAVNCDHCATWFASLVISESQWFNCVS